MYTLLIVDDEQAIRDGLSRFVDWNSIGFECIGTASGGHEALEFIQQKHPDVTLCDIRMPGMTGLDLAQILHQTQDPTRLVLLSAYRDFEYARTAMQYNVRYYIVKSARQFEIMDVFTKLREELDASHATRPDEDLLLRDIRQWVDRNLNIASLESVASHFGRSATNISKYYHRETGEMFSQFLTRRKMERAGNLLMDSRLRISEISEQVGYTNAQNFTRAFRQYYDMSPREYRERHGIINAEGDQGC